MIDKKAKPTKLLWIDLEMTGLEVDTDRILEVAAIVTDFDFKTLATYEAVIHYSDEVLSNMNPWCLEQHAKSGLTERVRTSIKSEVEVVSELSGFISTQFGKELAVLAGNSIHHDRNFIKRWWPDIERILHYRMVDVSSWKIIMEARRETKFDKKEAHRALEDIQASIAELQYYLEAIK